MPTVTHVPALRRAALPALLALGVALPLACSGGQGPTLTPPSLPETSPSPTIIGPVGTPRTPTPSPAATPWPEGWDLAFCTLFEELVVAQELARDIGRAFDEDARDDAAALARELDTTVERVRELAGQLPDWDDAAAFKEQLLALLDQDDQLVLYWLRHLEENRQPALGRAREVAGTLRETYVPAVQSELDGLADTGVACPGRELSLETP